MNDRNAADANTPNSKRSGGRILVDALKQQGTDIVYAVPGESFLAVLDALHDVESIRLVIARHEGAAANMAEADGKLTGRPGICFVTRGPGATHASVGVHTALQDSTPMILFIGQVDRRFLGREAFQEVEFRQMFAPLAKWVAEIESADRIPEYISRAYHVAMSGRPGPVVLSLPEDMLVELSDVQNLGYVSAVQSAPLSSDIDDVRSILAKAERPVLVLGGSGWTDAACADIRAFAEANSLPVALSFRRQDLFDNDFPNYAGHLGLGVNPKLATRVKEADLLIAVGLRMGETTSGGYTIIEAPRPKQKLIHIHADPGELGRVYKAERPIVSSMPAAAAALRAMAPYVDPVWKSETPIAHQDYQSFTKPKPPVPEYSGVYFAEVMSYLNDTLPKDTIITNGAGNYTVWVHRFYHYHQPRTELAPTSGAMGYGLPAAVASKVRYPNRTVICFAGDGCFMMYPQELACAVQEKAAIIVIIVNNGMYGTIRMHQERHYPGRITGTNLKNPDFVAFAKSFGAYGERVLSTEDFPAAFERAQNSKNVAVLELMVDPAQITPDVRLRI